MQTVSIPEIGQLAPDFRLRGGDGTYYSLSEFRGDRNVLLVFFPLAFSPVCSHQLPEVQRHIEQFEAADTVVLGISVDSRWSGAAFARALGLTFPLLSDWKRAVSKAYGVFLPEAGYSGRASFLVDKRGQILWREVSDSPGNVDAVPSVSAALAAIPRP